MKRESLPRSLLVAVVSISQEIPRKKIRPATSLSQNVSFMVPSPVSFRLRLLHPVSRAQRVVSVSSLLRCYSIYQASPMHADVLRRSVHRSAYLSTYRSIYGCDCMSVCTCIHAWRYPHRSPEGGEPSKRCFPPTPASFLSRPTYPHLKACTYIYMYVVPCLQ